MSTVGVNSVELRVAAFRVKGLGFRKLLTGGSFRGLCRGLLLPSA